MSRLGKFDVLGPYTPPTLLVAIWFIARTALIGDLSGVGKIQGSWDYVIVGLLVSSYFLAFKTRRPSRFPPGPRGLPFLGNLFDVPGDRVQYKFSEWKKSYGELIGLNILGRNILVLNSREGVKEIMHKRAQNYSDRPPLPIITEWGGIKWPFFTLPYNETVHNRRRMIFQSFNKDMFPIYEQHMLKAAMELARQLVHTPDKFYRLVNRMAGDTFLRVIYAYELDGEYDDWIRMADDFNYAFRALPKALGTNASEIVSFLTKLPPIVMGRELAGYFHRSTKGSKELLEIPYTVVKKDVDQHLAPPSMTTWLIEQNRQKDGSIANEDAIREVTAESFAAGNDATEAVLKVFLLAMMMYPEVQRKAQAHIDALVQDHRLPTLADRSSLLYIEAILKETLRWKPVAPIAFPRVANQDDEYKGYFIPKDTVVIPNSWECSHNEDDFPDPYNFIPERFTDGSKLLESPIDTGDFAFGYGKRVCPGRRLAEAALWINMVTLLSVFDIKAPVDKQGNEIKPDLDLQDSCAVSSPRPFLCDFVPRSKQRIELLDETFQECQPKVLPKPA